MSLALFSCAAIQLMLENDSFLIFEGIFDEIRLSGRVAYLSNPIARIKRSYKPHTKYLFCHVIGQVMHKISALSECDEEESSLKVLSCHERRKKQKRGPDTFFDFRGIICRDPKHFLK